MERMNIQHYSKKIYDDIKNLPYVNSYDFEIFMFSQQNCKKIILHGKFKNIPKIMFELDVIKIIKKDEKDEFFNYSLNCDNLDKSWKEVGIGSEYFLTLIIS